MLPLIVALVFVNTAADAGSRPPLGMGGTEAGSCIVQSADEPSLRSARRRVTRVTAAAGEVELVVVCRLLLTGVEPPAGGAASTGGEQLKTAGVLVHWLDSTTAGLPTVGGGASARVDDAFSPTAAAARRKSVDAGGSGRRRLGRTGAGAGMLVVERTD